MTESGESILFLGRYGCRYSDVFSDTILKKYKDAMLCLDGDPYGPEAGDLFQLKYDIIIAFRSRVIVPESAINSSKVAINFHPGPPEHPGSACVNWALYNKDKTYGCTAHFISKEIDSGEIIEVRRFPILENDDIASLLEKTYVEATSMFINIMQKLDNVDKIGVSGEKWIGKARTMKSLEEINFIEMKMDEMEVMRRIRSAHHPDFPLRLRLPNNSSVTLELKQTPS